MLTMEREVWSRKLEYSLSMIGYCVGLGNIWRFPYLCMRNGGGAFLIPFVFFLLTCGLPLYFLEVSIGQFTGKGNLHVWEVCPIFKGIGVGMTICLFVISVYYNIINTWTVFYFINSFLNPLPWENCDNDWNTENCVDRYYGSILVNGSEQQNTTFEILTMVNKTETRNFVKAEEEFWWIRVLHLSSGLDNLGGMSWYIVLCFLFAWIIVCLSLIKGVRSLGKVVYITAIMPYILLTIILIRGLTLPGSLNGIKYYIMPNFHQLTSIQVWLEAGLQVFYSLGPTWGPLITMASYNKFNNNCYRDSIILTLVSEGTSVFGGFAIFTIIGFMAHRANLNIPDIVQSGPGLGFLVYPEALAQLPLPNVWAVLFFFMLFTVGLDSQFATVEAVLTAFTDTFPWMQRNKVTSTVIICVIFFVLGLPICSYGGMYIFQLLDWYIAAFALPVFGILECIIFGWIYGAEMVSRDVQVMLGRPVPIYMRILWCFITPILLSILLVFGLLMYTPPKVRSYTYPGYARHIGWFIAALPLLPIPICAVTTYHKAKGASVTEKLKMCFKPSKDWMPVNTSEKSDFDLADRTYNCDVRERIKLNVLGSKSESI